MSDGLIAAGNRDPQEAVSWFLLFLETKHEMERIYARAADEFDLAGRLAAGMDEDDALSALQHEYIEPMIAAHKDAEMMGAVSQANGTWEILNEAHEAMVAAGELVETEPGIFRSVPESDRGATVLQFKAPAPPAVAPDLDKWEPQAQQFLGKSIHECDTQDLIRLRAAMVEAADKATAEGSVVEAARDRFPSCGCAKTFGEAVTGKFTHTCGASDD